MGRSYRIAIVSDIHYAGAAEQARGADYETRGVTSLAKRLGVRAYRHFLWMRDPLGQNHLVDRFLRDVGDVDLAVANGDYTCDTAFIGVADDAACASVRECLGKLRGRFGDRFHATLGDHDLGKKTMLGNAGQMRLASFERATGELGIAPFWQRDLGRWRLIGVCSTLVGLPHFQSEALLAEWPHWRAHREIHLEQIRAAFTGLTADQRVLLFCHDPTALPFLVQESAVSERIGQLEQTIIGHLHTDLVLWKARLLSGMPQIRCLGHTVGKLSRALREARAWQPFRVRLCPALAGIQLQRGGGFLTAELEDTARFEFHPLRR